MKRERGFTLIELLVVIAIMAVLFGVTALALSGVGDNADTVVKAAETDIVQTAIDIYLAQNASITARSTGKLVGPASGDPFSEYLRRESEYLYVWDTSGVVTQQ